MTDETQVETPIEDAPLADSSPAPEVETVETPSEPAADTQPRDEESGQYLSKNAQKRIDELTREKYERAREAEYWRQQAMQQKAPEPPPAPTKMPTLEEVGYDEAKYQAALLEYATKQAEKVVEERLTQREQQAKERAQVEKFASRSQEYAKTNPDYVEKVMRAPTLPIAEEVQSILRGMDTGPELAYYLATHYEEAVELMQLPTPVAMLHLGRVEARLEAQKEAAKRPPPVSKAPPPPPTVETTSAEVDKDPEEMTADQWARWREKQLRKTRK